MEPESLEILFEKIFETGNASGFRFGLNIVTYMLRVINPDFRGSDLIPMDADIPRLPLVVRKVLHFIPTLLQQITSPPVHREITNQSGRLSSFS